ncbi:sugar ABC transporter substrate-binding protein [Sporosarcina sp. ANT_H38]|uniref:ABC transporter substrate-binding protein n=1 Tax=Sporosarcina sp. ANT_H38 TaxID=2597358 RepID=UPI0011F2C405|nr:sugar ABC transporter substrate-binding protein [Sporosarcina sp. ANT_H38]KAA0965493.1 sugar ABC transporter substrate-binding protein [Sporosarcina sp. ANT_H38]
MKKYSLIFFSLILIFLAACSSDDSKGESKDDGTPKSVDKKENVELTFSIWGNDQHAEMYEELLKGFYDENPNIKVKIDLIPFPDYQQKMSVLAAGNELPDVGWVSEAMVSQFTKNDILSDISEFSKDDNFDMNDFIPSTLELWKHDGKLLGLPFSTPPMILYYNKTMFKEAGLETPTELAMKDEWTWEQFEEVSKALSSGEGTNRTYGARLFREWTNFATLPSHTISYGGAIFSDDMKEFTWDSSEGVKTFEMLNRMMFEDKSHVPPGENIEYEGGKVGMYSAMYSYMTNAREITDFEWDIAPLPKGPEGRVPLLGQAGIVAFEGGKHPEEAKELLKFLASKVGIQAQSVFFVPARKSVLESDEFINIPNNPSRESIQLAMIDQMNHGYTYPLHEDWTKIESEIIKGIDKLFAQMETPAVILEQMEKDIKPLLK